MQLKFNTTLFYLLFTFPLFCQDFELQRVEPANWWAGMKNPSLQLLVYGKNISQVQVSLSYPGVSVQKVGKAENPNYLFLNLIISPEAQPGKFTIQFQAGKRKKNYEYELKKRRKAGEAYKGFDASDVIYLIMPDRFANGDESNDQPPGILEKINRKDPFGRHGGDLKGILDNLDYFTEMGITALWLNPILENNMPKTSYHGYAITDFYKVDARFGSNEFYAELTEKCRQRGIKMIQDMVFNHCGSEHWFFKDLPFKDWVHQFPEYTSSNYRLSIQADPYVSNFDRDKMLTGWFDRTMPDLNQRNPYLATYLIQNSIWWVEYVGLDGIRMDTHPYPYKEFMSEWMQAILSEYPNYKVVGEIWEDKVMLTSYWQSESKNQDGYQGFLPSVTDFPLCFALNLAFNEKDEWDKGLAKIYYTLVQDAMYSRPLDNVIFLDNHDLTRYATSINSNVKKMKMGLAALATLRGIPQIFYGTELLITGPDDNHGVLRADFPGGWKGDVKNAFTPVGRSSDQNEVFDYMKKLLQWRKNKEVIHTGKLMHFIPENGIYVYFRFNEKESVMVLLNNSEENKTLDTRRFAERMKGFRTASNVISGEKLSDLTQINIAGKSALILELEK